MDSLANQARHVADTFMQQSVELRLGYEYRQGFVSEAEAQNLRELARRAGAELENIAQQQAKLKKQIENYSGEDWDSRYGDSGIWRMLAADIANTTILTCQIEYYRAQASPQYEQAKILKNALDQLARLPEATNILLVKADIYALLGKTDQSSKELGGELYRKILTGGNVRDEVYYRASVAAQKLNPPLSPQVLDELAAKMDRSDCENNFELHMTLAFLQQRVGSTAIFERTVSRWPQAKIFTGTLILADLAAQTVPRVSKLSVFEADCVAAAALQNQPAQYRDLLEMLSQVPDFQTGRVLYATAVADSEKSPSKAIELFIKASNSQREPNDGFERPAGIARQGAVLAINFFKAEPAKCELVRHAIENYLALAGGTVDEQIEYSYGDILSDCGDSAAAVKLLQKIATRTNSAFGQHARFDLLALAINREPSPQIRIQLAEQLSDLVRASDAQQQVQADAKTLYCRVMLDMNNPAAAKKVLTVLETGPGLASHEVIFKSQAMFQLGRLVDAAKVLAVSDVNICDCRGYALNLLARYVDRIDEYADSNSTVDAFYEIGRSAMACSDKQSRQYTAVLYAQSALFAARGQKNKLAEVEKLLNKIDDNSFDAITARARLAAAKGKYEDAAKQWGAICEILKTLPNEPPQHSWHWWQAKYFELENSFKMPNASRADITHSIEVLQNSFNQIPPFWDKRLKALAATR